MLTIIIIIGAGERTAGFEKLDLKETGQAPRRFELSEDASKAK